MILDRAKLIEKLDRAATRAVSVAVEKGYPLTLSSRSTIIGTTIVGKNSQGMYNISLISGRLLYENISVFDVAVIIAQRYNNGEHSVIRKVLSLEERYIKYRTDMQHYLHCFRSAHRRRDFERMAILEDKFQASEMLAKSIRDHIALFKRTK